MASRRLFGPRSERGAVAVEAAIVSPLLLVLLLGIVEMSLLMRDVVSTNSAVRTGARVASSSAGAGPGTCQASSNPPPCTPASAPAVAQAAADPRPSRPATTPRPPPPAAAPAVAQAAADAIDRAGSAMPKNSIQSLTVYSANAQGFPLPAGNTSMTCSSKCVVYVWDAPL